ncbi:hypothetical protein PRIEUP_LOCUS14985 [Pristimantis euphronides]
MGSLTAVWCVILMEGAALSAAVECTRGNYKVNMNGKSICCPPCSTSENYQPCSNAYLREHVECRCREGYGCISKSCTQCKILPDCKKDNSMLKSSEDSRSIYKYECEKCSRGTYLEIEDGICKPGGPPPSTAASYSFVPSTQKPESNATTTDISKMKDYTEPSYNKWTFLVVFLALAVLILLLITVAIHLLLWKMKAVQLLKTAGLY